MTKRISGNKPTITQNKKELTLFIDPFSDFGFKRIFGGERNKNILIGFLNSIFKGRKLIVDITHRNPEVNGLVRDSRKTVFDLCCTGDNGEEFIVEMQKAKVKNFKDRSIFYTANLIHNEGRSVPADWNYKLPEVYFVAIMDFKFDNTNPAHFLHDVRLMEVNTNKEFYSKLSYTFIEMPKFGKALGELETELDEWLYILNNLEEFLEIPVSLSGNSKYDKLFELARVSNLTEDEMNEYEQRLKIRRDNYSAMETAFEEGIEKGRQNEALEIAKNLKNIGIAIDDILKGTGLSVETVESL